LQLLTDSQLPGRQIDILPAQARGFAEPQPARQRHGEERTETMRPCCLQKRLRPVRIGSSVRVPLAELKVWIEQQASGTKSRCVNPSSAGREGNPSSPRGAK
jgi:hypothetical protein